MTTLYAASREALAEGLRASSELTDSTLVHPGWVEGYGSTLADRLIDSGVVKVIDCPHERCPCACHLEDVP